MKRLLLFACCLAFLGCGHPDLDGSADQPKQPTERQLRNKAVRKNLREFNEYLNNIRTVGLVTPDVLIYELTPGGIGEIIEEWSDQGSAQFAESVAAELKARNITAKPIKAADNDKARMPDAVYLFRAISGSIGWNEVYRKAICPDVQVCPDYSLGPVDHFFKDPAVEALFVVLASSDVPAPDPAAVPPMPKPGANDSDGAANVPDPDADKRPPKKKRTSRYTMINGRIFATGTYVSMALVDRQGTILWYGGKATRKVDLRTRESVDEMTRMTLNLLRKEKK